MTTKWWRVPFRRRTPTIDAVVRTLPPVRREPGRHRVTWRCGGVWSNDVWFYWIGR